MIGSQEPRLRVVPDGEDHPRWDEIQEWVAGLGYELDAWQLEVLRVSLMRQGDLWAAFTVAVCAPRQNGKNTLLEVVELVKSVFLGERLIIHTAHLADTSQEAFHRLDNAIDDNKSLRDQLRHVWRTNGKETVEFRGGRRIRFRTRTRGGGRGYAGCKTAIFDEAMFLPEVAMGSILPVISAAPDPQIWYTGSAVDQEIMDEGVVFARVRERAMRGGTERLAYFEWSLDASKPDQVDDRVARDPASWAATNPAFGVRIMEDYLRVEREELDPRTFAVERLGVGDWPDTKKAPAVVDLEKWAGLQEAGSAPVDPVVFGFDVKPDRSAGSICVAGARSDGFAHIEVVERRRGTDWIVPRLLELRCRHKTAGLVCDTAGPASSLLPQLEHVDVTTVTAPEMAKACGFFFDAVEEGTLRHLGQPELFAALKGAARRPLGDAWAWSRKNSTVDISPLVGCTLALWASQTVAAHDLIAVAW